MWLCARHAPAGRPGWRCNETPSPAPLPRLRLLHTVRCCFRPSCRRSSAITHCFSAVLIGTKRVFSLDVASFPLLPRQKCGACRSCLPCGKD